MGNGRQPPPVFIHTTALVVMPLSCRRDVDLRGLLRGGKLLLFLFQQRQPLRAFGLRLGDLFLGLQRRFVTLAFDRVAAAQVRALERAGLAEEVVTPGHQHRHELLPETARIAVRRQRRIHVVADAVVEDAAAAFELIRRVGERLVPGLSRPRRAPRQRQAGERKLADASLLVEHDIAQIGAAPLAQVGLGALDDDARDVALALFGFGGRAALEIDGKRDAMELGFAGDVARREFVVQRGVIAERDESRIHRSQDQDRKKAT